MPRRPVVILSLLRCMQQAVVRHETNAYQIAKATGLPLRSVQKLLAQKSNPTLKNIEVIFTGLGLALYVQAQGRKTIKPRKRTPVPSDGVKRTGS
jgi:DNA-binding phage protein